MSLDQTFDLRLVRTLRASPERVYAAFVDPGLLARWMCPEGFHVAEVVAEARPGGAFRLVMVGPDGRRYPTAGTYLELAPPGRLVLTWRWEPEHEMAGVETRIEVEIVAVAEGARLTMRHSGFPDAGERAGHDAGWSSALGKLARLLEEETTR